MLVINVVFNILKLLILLMFILQNNINDINVIIFSFLVINFNNIIITIYINIIIIIYFINILNIITTSINIIYIYMKSIFNIINIFISIIFSCIKNIYDIIIKN